MTHAILNGINSFNPCLINSFKNDAKLMTSLYASQLAGSAPFKPPTPSSLAIGSSESSDSMSSISAAEGLQKQMITQALAMLTPGISPVSYGINGLPPGKECG